MKLAQEHVQWQASSCSERTSASNFVTRVLLFCKFPYSRNFGLFCIHLQFHLNYIS
jgi:hypothetical protein